MDQCLVEVEHKCELGCIVVLRWKVSHIGKRWIKRANFRRGSCFLLLCPCTYDMLIRIICGEVGCSSEGCFVLLERLACIKECHQVRFPLEDVVVGSAGLTQVLQLLRNSRFIVA